MSRLVESGRVAAHAADLTFTACATVTAAGLDGELARLGQWFAVDGPEEGEVGLMVSGDSTGPLRLGFGGWRDVLLGVQVEDGRGRLISVGGRVMKNVAGYDLTKFMVGQAGVFGRVVTVTGRTYRRPEGAVAARFSGAVEVARLRPQPSWVVETRGGTWAGWLGDRAAVAHAGGMLGRETGVQVIEQGLEEDGALRRRLWAYPGGGAGGEGGCLKVSVPVGRVGAFVVGARVKEWVADPWHGVVLVRAETGQVGAVRDSAWAVGGRAEGEGLPVRVTAAEAGVLRRMKHELDPEGNLNPLELEVV